MRVAAILLFLVLSTGQGFTQGATFDLTVKADPTKASKSPWDGVPGLARSRVNINEPPDIAVCIVQAEGKPQCLWKPQGRRLLSICQNSLTCTFENVTLPPPPFGLLFLDIDARLHDLIDIVILSGNATGRGEPDIERALFKAMTTLTPGLSENAKERGVDKVKVLPLQQCAGSDPCRLTQSEFQLKRKGQP
jgi:hypothetical protein